MTAGLPNDLAVVDHPRGALALATAAAERGLKAWSTGQCTIGEDLSKKKLDEFSEANWGEATKLVRSSVDRLSDKKWKKIIAAAMEAAPALKTTPWQSKPADADIEDARALAYESDSSDGD